MPSVGRSLSEKSGTLDPVSFSGNPKEAAVSFGSPLPSADYSVVVDVEVSGSRTFAHAVKSKTPSGFIVSLCADNIAGLVRVGWQAALEGET